MKLQVAELEIQIPQEIRNPKHYDWLALYQVRGLSAAQIADAVNTDQRTLNANTIGRAIPKTAKLISLTLRKTKKGSGPKFHKKTLGRTARRR